MPLGAEEDLPCHERLVHALVDPVVGPHANEPHVEGVPEDAGEAVHADPSSPPIPDPEVPEKKGELPERVFARGVPDEGEPDEWPAVRIDDLGLPGAAIQIPERCPHWDRGPVLAAS